MNTLQKEAAQMYAIHSISDSQVKELCNTPQEYAECMKYAKEYISKISKLIK